MNRSANTVRYDLEVEQEISEADPGSIKSPTEQLKQIKALLDAELCSGRSGREKIKNRSCKKPSPR